MAIEFRDLRWAIIAAHHRSLRQAAETLNVRQSSLSRAIRDLDGQLGATQFEGLDGLLTMVGAGWGLLLALEGATGAVYTDVVFRGVHDPEGRHA